MTNLTNLNISSNSSAVTENGLECNPLSTGVRSQPDVLFLIIHGVQDKLVSTTDVTGISPPRDLPLLGEIPSDFALPGYL